MVKTKVSDLASELGVPPEQLMTLLKELHVQARGPQSSLEAEQVAAVRVRWEREKRKKVEEPAKKPKRRVTKAAVAKEEPPAPVESAARPSKRRRTAAEVAEVEAIQEAERQARPRPPLPLPSSWSVRFSKGRNRRRPPGSRCRPSTSAPEPSSRTCRPSRPSRSRWKRRRLNRRRRVPNGRYRRPGRLSPIAHRLRIAPRSFHLGCLGRRPAPNRAVPARRPAVRGRSLAAALPELRARPLAPANAPVARAAMA
ncbi:MAG: hypothetical protein HOP28_04920, partial [Gemmatimonadales bacterium]|nr:hypothetical protein [Gemmatimonadales bacterium]